MAICGLNPNVDALKGELTSKVAGFLDLETSFTTPDSITSYLSTFKGGIDSIKSKVDLALPDIPTSISGVTSLRDQLASYVSLPSVSGLTDITSQFGDLTSLPGMANFNLSDMASSALSLGGSFDPCSLAGDLNIPNIVADSTGALQALPTIQPDLGATFEAITIADSLMPAVIADSVVTATEGNEAIVSTLAPLEADLAISSNVSGAITGMGDTVRKLPTGVEEVQTKESFVAEVKERTPILKETATTYTAPVQIDTSKLTNFSDDWDFETYRKARRVAYRKFALENPSLRGGNRRRAFQAKLESNEVILKDYIPLSQSMGKHPYQEELRSAGVM